jgi:hypothetical protein
MNVSARFPVGGAGIYLYWFYNTVNALAPKAF